MVDNFRFSIPQGNFILSNRKTFSDEKYINRRNLFETLEIGQTIKGEVVRITDFRAFIDIGGIDDQLPVSKFFGDGLTIHQIY